MYIQEEIDNKTIALAVTTAKMTSRALQAAIREYQRQRQNHKNNKQVKGYQGKQTIKQLVKSGAALSNIEITDENIKSFEQTAKKYGIDYALKRIIRSSPRNTSYFSRVRTRTLSQWRLMSIPKSRYVRNRLSVKCCRR